MSGRRSDTFDPNGESVAVEPSPTAAPVSGPEGPSGAPPGGPPGDLGLLHLVSRDEYEVLAEFARGGLGRVIRARDRRTGRIVAIKETLRPSAAGLARFAREAFVTANLQHPAIVPVYEVGRWAEGGQPFYAMKLVAGSSLEDALVRTRSLGERLALLPHAIAVAEALAYAHGQGVIHRDLKPANVLIGDFGETVVIDWGLAKRMRGGDAPLPPDDPGEAAQGRTMTGAVLGTPGYMAPEQARGAEVDERVDVYALGAMLYEMLSGVRTYAESPGIEEIVRRTLEGPPRPLLELEPTLPQELVAIVDRAMALDPADRYPTAKEFADDLRRFQTGQLVGAHRYTLGELVRRQVRRHLGVVVASAVAGVILLAGGVVSLVSIEAARQRAVAAQQVAEERLVRLYTESARRWLDEDNAPKALPYLAEALATGAAGPEVAFLAGQALEAVEAAGPVLVGHLGPVLYLGWSPDGADLLSSGGDLFVGRWDARTGEKRWLSQLGTAAVWSRDGRGIHSVEMSGKIATWTPEGELVREIPFVGPEGREDTARGLVTSPGGRYVAALGQEGAVMWWDAASGGVVGRVRASAGRVIALAWTPDDGALLAGGDGGRVGLWASADAAPLAAWDLHAEGVQAIAVSPDGRAAVSGGDDGAVVFVDLTRRRVAARMSGHTGAVMDVAWDPAGTEVLSVSLDRTARVWRAGPDPGPLAVATATTPLHLGAWIADGFVTAGEDGAIDRWTPTGLHRSRWVGHTSAVAALAVSPDGRTLASGALDQLVRTWALGTPAPGARLDVEGTVAARGLVTPDGGAYLVTGRDGVARVFDPTGARRARLVGHGGEVLSVAASADRYATGSADGTARTWDARTGAPLLTIPVAGGRARWVGFSPDGARLVTVEGDGAARIRDAATGEVGATLTSTYGALRTASWSPDGARIVTPTEGPGATLWDAATATRVVDIPVLATESYGVGWSADGARFLLTSGGPDVTMHAARDGALEKVFSGHAMGPIAAATLSPDGTTALTAGFDGTARTWDVATGAQRFAVGDAAEPVIGAAFRPDGAVFVTSGGGGGVSAWGTRTGQRLRRWTDVPAQPAGVAFTPDGAALLVLGLDGAPALLRTADWTAGAAALQGWVACEVPWRLDAGVLIASVPVSRLCRAP